MLTPYGHDNAFVMLMIGAGFLGLAFTPIGPILSTLSICLGLLIIAFTMWFFRDPRRPLSKEAQGDLALIVAPSDGQVTELLEVSNMPELGGPATQITIFLSPVNLHVNRYPATGTIESAEYVPGKYLMAFNPKASEENERSIFVLQTAFGKILYRQITGFLARRIVYDTKKGDVVSAGNRFGMMKFGSRMDVVVPRGAEIFVKVGQKVVSSDTILARMPYPGPTEQSGT